MAFIRPSRARGGDLLNRKARPGRAGGGRGSPPQTFAKQLLLLRISCRKVRIMRRVQLVSVHDHRHWARCSYRWRSQLTSQAVLFHSPLHGSPPPSPGFMGMIRALAPLSMGRPGIGPHRSAGDDIGTPQDSCCDCSALGLPRLRRFAAMPWRATGEAIISVSRAAAGFMIRWKRGRFS